MLVPNAPKSIETNVEGSGTVTTLMPPVVESPNTISFPEGSLPPVAANAENVMGISPAGAELDNAKLTNPRLTVSPGVKVTPVDEVE